MTTVTSPRQRIAVMRGIFAKPGVSENRRLYTSDHIRAAVDEAKGLIESGNAPAVFGAMMTHHGARDPRMGDVTHTAGRLTKVELSPEGWGIFEAELADTAAGRDVAALTTPEKPYLKGVSMAARWVGQPRVVRAPDGLPAETADGFSLIGIDFTHHPGVAGAQIESATIQETAPGGVFWESADGLSAMTADQLAKASGRLGPALFRSFAESGRPRPITEAKEAAMADVTISRKALGQLTAQAAKIALEAAGVPQSPAPGLMAPLGPDAATSNADRDWYDQRDAANRALADAAATRDPSSWSHADLEAMAAAAWQ